MRIDNRKNFLPAQRGVEPPGFGRVGCGHEGEVFWNRRGSRGPRPSPALSLLQVSEVIQGKGGWQGLRETGEGGEDSLIHLAGVSWDAAHPNRATLQGAGHSNGHMEEGPWFPLPLPVSREGLSGEGWFGLPLGEESLLQAELTAPGRANATCKGLEGRASMVLLM